MTGPSATDQLLRKAPPIRVCLIGLFAFAVARDDAALIDALDSIAETPPSEGDKRAPLEDLLGRALRHAVDDAELIWWQQAEALARVPGRNRAIYHRLARLRLKSS